MFLGNRKFVVLWILLLNISVFAQNQQTDNSLLTIDRIFNSEDFNAKGIGGLDGSSLVMHIPKLSPQQR